MRILQFHLNSLVEYQVHVTKSSDWFILLCRCCATLAEIPVRDQRSLLPEASGFANSPGANQLESQAEKSTTSPTKATWRCLIPLQCKHSAFCEFRRPSDASMKWRSSSGSHAKKSCSTSGEYWEEESSPGSFEQLPEAPKLYIPEHIRPQDFCYCSVRRASSWWYCMFSDVNPAHWKVIFSKPIVPSRAALLHRARLKLCANLQYAGCVAERVGKPLLKRVETTYLSSCLIVGSLSHL